MRLPAVRTSATNRRIHVLLVQGSGACSKLQEAGVFTASACMLLNVGGGHACIMHAKQIAARTLLSLPRALVFPQFFVSQSVD